MERLGRVGCSGVLRKLARLSWLQEMGMATWEKHGKYNGLMIEVILFLYVFDFF